MDATWIWLGLAVVCLAYLIGRRIQFERAEMSDLARQRLREANRRVMWTPPQLGALVTGPIVGVALVSSAWWVGSAALLVSVVLLWLHERRRRATLEEAGFGLNRWGTVNRFPDDHLRGRSND